VVCILAKIFFTKLTIKTTPQAIHLHKPNYQITSGKSAYINSPLTGHRDAGMNCCCDSNTKTLINELDNP